MKPTILALAALCSVSHANLVITEVMAQSSHTSSDANGDWWELTNTGTNPVNLSGYKWDDTPTPGAPTVSGFPNFIIQPGESIIILDEPASNVSTWKAAWGLGSTRVIDRDAFALMGVEPFSGLSVGGDEVNLYDPLGDLVASVSFGASTTGISQAWRRDGTPVLGLNSSVGKEGAYASNQSPADIASPGNGRAHFTSTPGIYAKYSYQYEVSAVRPGFVAPAISAVSIPSFLTFVPGAGGSAVLSSNRALTLADAGEHLVQLSAGGTTHEYVLTVFNPLPSVILNEYNAVSASNYLNGGNAISDEDGPPAAADTHFGRVQGNGGQWVEFVVTGENSAASIDLRGYRFEIGTNNGSGFIVRNTLVLSNHANWETIPAGTILTFIDRTTAQGGLDSGFAIRDRRDTVGDVWTNIWMGDTTHLSHTGFVTNGYTITGGVVGGILIDNNATQFRVKNAAGAVIYGPAGEGVAPVSGTNSREVLELKAHPTAAVTPTDQASPSGFGYDDGASESTFGHPNNWTVGETVFTQRFTSLTAPEIGVLAGVTPVADDGGIDFGTILEGTATSIDITVTNTGTADLKEVSAGIIGADADSFSLIGAPSATVPAPNGSTSFSVSFAPASAGAKTAILRIASNDEDEDPYDVILTGEASAAIPEIAVRISGGAGIASGGSLSFGTRNTNTATPITLGVLSTGTAALEGVSAAITGAHASEFRIIASPAATINPLESGTLTISFSPKAGGLRSAVLSIASNDADESPYIITLSGTAVVPLPEISVQQPRGSELTDGVARRTFGNVKLRKAMTKTFVIRNLGKANLTGLAITKTGKHAKDFVVRKPLRSTLAPGTSTTFKVTFRPKAKGVRNAAIRIANNDPNENPFDIRLTGRGRK